MFTTKINFFLIFFGIWSSFQAGNADVLSEQVHASLGVNSSEIWITWMTLSDSNSQIPIVVFEPENTFFNEDFSKKSFGFSKYYSNEGRDSWIHRVLLKGFLPKTVYCYKVGFENSLSKLYKIKTPPAPDEEWLPRLAIYGDLGVSNGISIPYLNAVANKYDAILHVGDMAYDLPSNKGKTGDEFFNLMEPSMSSILYQVVAGNHESWKNFSQYDARFTMIDQTSGERNNHFYSFNLGPLHIIGYNTEFYYWYYDDPSRNLRQTQTQWEWLEQELKRANSPENRKKQPWIIVMGHRPMYCSTADSDDCVYNECILRKGIPIVNRYGLEDLFFKYDVDIIIAGHEHTYERLFPVYDRNVFNGTNSDNPYDNPPVPIHLLVGSGGCPEIIDPFIHNPKPWSAKRISDYGITDFKVINRTHIHVKQRSTTPARSGKVVDNFMIIKNDKYS